MLQLHPPTITTLNKIRYLKNNDNIGCVKRYIFSSLEKNYDYYLQLLNRSNGKDMHNELKDYMVYYLIQTSYLNFFPIALIHAGFFSDL